jgi:hypothetical protein
MHGKYVKFSFTVIEHNGLYDKCELNNLNTIHCPDLFFKKNIYHVEHWGSEQTGPSVNGRYWWKIWFKSVGLPKIYSLLEEWTKVFREKNYCGTCKYVAYTLHKLSCQTGNCFRDSIILSISRISVSHANCIQVAEPCTGSPRNLASRLLSTMAYMINVNWTI